MPISIRWLGNAGYYAQFSESKVVIDPYFTRPQATNLFYGRVSPDVTAIRAYSGACDAVLISHAHFDHCMDAPDLARLHKATYYGSENACTIARACGLAERQIQRIQAQDAFTIGEVQVTVIPARHPWIPGYTRGETSNNLQPPLHLQDYRMDDCFSFLLASAAGSVLVWSSTSSQEAQKADILICRAVSSQRWYEHLLAEVNPRWVIPSHWDDMFQPLSADPTPFFSAPQFALPPIQRIDLLEFERKVKKAHPGCRVLLPRRFMDYRLI